MAFGSFWGSNFLTPLEWDRASSKPDCGLVLSQAHPIDLGKGKGDLHNVYPPGPRGMHLAECFTAFHFPKEDNQLKLIDQNLNLKNLNDIIYHLHAISTLIRISSATNLSGSGVSRLTRACSPLVSTATPWGVDSPVETSSMDLRRRKHGILSIFGWIHTRSTAFIYKFKCLHVYLS